jgi:hypothetical protein
LNSQAYTNAFSTDNDGRSVEEQEGVPGSPLEEYRSLIALRNTHPALRRGSYLPVTASTTRVWGFVRNDGGSGETLLVVVNVHGVEQSVALDLAQFEIPSGVSPVIDVTTGAYATGLTDSNKAAYPVTVEGYGYRILAMSLFGGPPGDGDGDGDVDLEDYESLWRCLSGPGVFPIGPGCMTLDLDGDEDVDLGDVAIFAHAFGSAV